MKNKYSKYINEIGLDEVGRGCLAGVVVACGALLPGNFYSKEITDSKKLSAKKRKLLSNIIKKESIEYSIQEVSVKEIDKVNILNASILAMHRCVAHFKHTPQFLLVDGNKFTIYKNIPHKCIVKGDSKYLNIAAASILAKVYRDELMMQLHEKYPEYNWRNNKGYPTKEHKKAILKYGITPFHRKSFKLLPTQYSLDL